MYTKKDAWRKQEQRLEQMKRQVVEAMHRTYLVTEAAPDPSQP
jgi:hypothetical protein